jgi:MFS family permease
MAGAPRDDDDDGAPARRRPMTREERRVVVASSLGTVFEWYDFYLYGALTGVIGANFFGQFDEATRTRLALLAFAAGFVVRPVGALVFGRLGDLVGRKYALLVTMLIMGGSTFLVGVLPGSEQIGVAAALVLVLLRLAQGFALGGEYGGAATYVAEYAPRGRRGFYTAWIQTTATLGLLASLVVILAAEEALGREAFERWGWRIPFLLSVVLLGVSVWIRLRLEESPVFRRIKQEGAHSRAPLREAFGRWRNTRLALIALFGLVAGQGVVWYAGQFYALFFLQSLLKVDGRTAAMLVAWSLLLGCGFFVLFGWLSDRIGRKPIILAGCAAAALTYFPLFEALTANANPALHAAQRSVPVVLAADPATCSLQFNPTESRLFTSACDIAKAALARASVAYAQQAAQPGADATIRIAGRVVEAFDAGPFPPPERAARTAQFHEALAAALTEAGYPPAANPSVVRMAHPLDLFRPQVATLVLLLLVLVVWVAMVYGPIAAALAELFPTRIRYSAVSLPYHIGNGWFGGILPATAFAIVAQTGDIHAGLWYPIGVAAATVVVGLLLVPETRGRDITADDAPRPPA